MDPTRRLFPAAWLGGLLACASAAAQQYTVVDLGALDLPNGNSVARGMNSAGDVVGFAFEPRDARQERAFLYSHGQQHEIRDTCGYHVRAVAINDSGDVVIQCLTRTHEASFVLHDGKPIPQVVTRNQLQFRAINNSGEAVGNYYGDYPPPDCTCFRAVRGLKFQFSDLAPLAGIYKENVEANAVAINDSGLIAGEAASRAHWLSPQQHAVTWAADGVHDLGTLGGQDSGATGLNASGDVVGHAETASHEQHAFLYRNGVMKDLGTLGGDSEASAINASGLIVGKSRIDRKSQHFWNGFPETRAFLYVNGVMTDLNSLVTGSLADAITLQEASAINDSGLIAATGLDKRSGARRAYLLMPIPASTAPK